MRVRRLSVLLWSVWFGVMATGCARNPDQEIESALKDVYAFTGELIKRLESAADPAVGVDEAQKYLDARKAEIGAKTGVLRKIKDAELSAATRARKMESLTDDLMSVNGLQIRFMTNAMNDDAFKSRLEKLLNDYRALIEV